ncbi:hypothetical protein PMAYCL1PPCAC_25147, partial [Pristionchus mayeri]
CQFSTGMEPSIMDPSTLHVYNNLEEGEINSDVEHDDDILIHTNHRPPILPQDDPLPLSIPLAATRALLNALRDDRDEPDAENTVFYAYQMTEAEAKAHRQELESQELGKRQERLKREEDALVREVAVREERLRHKAEQQSRERLAQLERENSENAAIARLLNEVQMRQERLRVMHEEREAQESDLKKEEDDLILARTMAVSKREERIKAMKEYDDHPSSLSITYSRECTICRSANPRRRATLIACGHMMCATCAEQLAAGPSASGDQFPCPYCRMMTGFVQTFEDPVKVPEVVRPQQIEGSRKRESEGTRSYPSSSKKEFRGFRQNLD